MPSMTDFDQNCDHGDRNACIIIYIHYFWNLLLGTLPIIWITADICRAFKKRRHWIPCVSVVLSSFSLQLFMLLNNSLGYNGYDNVSVGESNNNGSVVYYNFHIISKNSGCNTFQESWVPTLAGRVSVCVFMGCLLPGVANPLSPTMWTDMAALIVSSSIPLFQITYDTYTLVKQDENTRCETLTLWWNVTILTSIIVLVVLLSSAAMSSFGIYRIVCRKIPIILSLRKFNHQFSWEKVEEHIINSVLVVHSSNPQYILARSIFTSPIALIIAISNGILIQVSLLVHIYIIGAIQICLLYPFIMLGSCVIFWRCISATIHYPRKISWKWASIKEYFKMENFWLSYLEELEAWFLKVEGKSRSPFRKLMIKLWRGMVLHRSLQMLIWIQTFLVVFSKACWLVLQLLISNKYMERLFMRSEFQEFSYLSREEDQLGIVIGKAPEYDKYCKALLQLPGECSAGIWIANRKSIKFIEKQIKKGEEEGKKCNELMWLLKHKSSPDFSGKKHVKPHQNYPVTRLEVERELDVCNPSFKMAVVSLVTLLAELASFIPISDHNNLINKAIEACSQAWNIMDIVDDSQSELSKSADKLFQDLHKSRTWLGYHLPLSKAVGNSVGAVKASIQNIVNKAKEMAMEHKSGKWEEVAAGYRLYCLCLNLNYQELTSVEEIVEKMCSVLADVVASCTVKAVGVAVNDCKKWAAMFDEESILRAAHIAGKVKNLMENVEWQLKWSFSEETESLETSVERATNCRLLRKYATFQN